MDKDFAGAGYAGIFLMVFVEQIGAPIPAFPLLFAAGVLAAGGRLDAGAVLAVATVASLLADGIWYGLGRSRGAGILNLLCKISWNPDTCISSTKDFFARYGAKTLVFAKFFPGLNTIAPPLAGIVGIPWRRFLGYDALGCVASCAVPIFLGVYFRENIPSTADLWIWFRSFWPWLLAGFVGAILIWRFPRRWLYRRDLMREVRAGISLEDLRKKLEDADPKVVVLDIRHPMELASRPQKLPGALHIGHHELERRVGEVPLERDIIVYCDCPHEEGAVAMVKVLRKHGAKSVRPLVGGLRGWEQRGFPVEKPD
jgi:membrane protein DedA with SNARE-associated domain/rhodanese-related sulfurtransferase